jgi:ATP-dependent RNA helicase DeaD
MFDHPALTATLDDMTIAQDLLARIGAEQVATAFVQLWREGRPPPEELSDTPRHSDAAPRAPREFGPSIWFALSVGHEGRAEARWLLPKICDAGGITRDAIGAIRVRERETYVQIATADVPRFGDRIEIEPGLTMTRLKGEPALDRNTDGHGAPKPKKPGRGQALKVQGSAPVKPVRADRPAPAPAEAPSPVAKEAAPATAPKAKVRWTTAKKAAKARKAHAAPAQDGKQAWDKSKPRSGGKPRAAGAGKPKGKHAPTRHPNGGNAPPRRFKAAR